MRIEFKSYNNNSSLVSAILFFILGAIMFTNPGAMVVVISRILGGILILFGLYLELICFLKSHPFPFPPRISVPPEITAPCSGLSQPLPVPIFPRRNRALHLLTPKSYHAPFHLTTTLYKP